MCLFCQLFCRLSVELFPSGCSACISVVVCVKMTTLKLNSGGSLVALNRKRSVHTSRGRCQCILKYFRIGRVLAVGENMKLRMLNAVIVEVFLFLQPVKLQDQLLNEYLRWYKKREKHCNAKKLRNYIRLIEQHLTDINQCFTDLLVLLSECSLLYNGSIVSEANKIVFIANNSN